MDWQLEHVTQDTNGKRFLFFTLSLSLRAQGCNQHLLLRTPVVCSSGLMTPLALTVLLFSI